MYCPSAGNERHAAGLSPCVRWTILESRPVPFQIESPSTRVIQPEAAVVERSTTDGEISNGCILQARTTPLVWQQPGLRPARRRPSNASAAHLIRTSFRIGRGLSADNAKPMSLKATWQRPAHLGRQLNPDASLFLAVPNNRWASGTDRVLTWVLRHDDPAARSRSARFVQRF